MPARVTTKYVNDTPKNFQIIVPSYTMGLTWGIGNEWRISSRSHQITA